MLAERNRRDALVAEVERTAEAERAALAGVERADAARGRRPTPLATRPSAPRAPPAAARDEAAEAERHVGFLHRAAPGRARRGRRRPSAAPRSRRRSPTERRLAERAEREREQRTRRIAAERDRLGLDEALRPAAERLAAALEAARDAVADARRGARGRAARRPPGGRAAGRGAARLRGRGEPRAGAAARSAGRPSRAARCAPSRLRDQAADAEAELTAVATKLGLEAEPASEALPDEEREGLAGRIERLHRRREQLGPVNPLAQAGVRRGGRARRGPRAPARGPRGRACASSRG